LWQFQHLMSDLGRRGGSCGGGFAGTDTLTAAAVVVIVGARAVGGW